MKISLFTIWHVKNYGAEMQTYSTVKILEELGHDVEVVSFYLSDIQNKTIKSKVIQLISRMTKETYKFERFWKNRIPSSKRYKTLKSILDNPPESDAYIVGSDQVWNPEITKDALALFLLEFGNCNIRRISYASSFGRMNWNNDNDFCQRIVQSLSTFHSVSVRESSSVKMLNSISDIQAENVLDPTLLFEGYPELTGKNTLENETLVYYPLIDNPKMEKLCFLIAKQRGLNYININNKKYLYRKIVWNRPSTEEWIRSIAKSSFVITPSFHGLAFSLIYKKQFIIVAEDLKKTVRITDLLEQLGLSDRFFTNVDDVLKSNVLNTPIDYTIVSNKLEKLRKKSIDFLRSSLS